MKTLYFLNKKSKPGRKQTFLTIFTQSSLSKVNTSTTECWKIALYTKTAPKALAKLDLLKF